MTSLPQSNAASPLRGSVAGISFSAHRRNAQQRDRGGHRVGGELAAAGAGAGAGLVFELLELRAGHLPGRAGADRFEDVLDRDVVPAGNVPAMIEPP